jgi:hypothetical protein
MAMDPQRMAAILQRIQPANQGGAPMPAPDMAPMGGPPMGGPMDAPQGVPMQINGTMTPQPQGGPPMGGPRPMMPR